MDLIIKVVYWNDFLFCRSFPVKRKSSTRVPMKLILMTQFMF